MYIHRLSPSILPIFVISSLSCPVLIEPVLYIGIVPGELLHIVHALKPSDTHRVPVFHEQHNSLSVLVAALLLRFPVYCQRKFLVR